MSPELEGSPDQPSSFIALKKHDLRTERRPFIPCVHRPAGQGCGRDQLLRPQAFAFRGEDDGPSEVVLDGRHQDLVLGRVLDLAARPVPDADADPDLSKPPQAQLGLVRELLDYLNAPNPGRELGQYCCLTTQADADLERRLPRSRGEEVGHDAQMKGCEMVLPKPIGSGVSR